MNLPISALPTLAHDDEAVNRPLECVCGFTAPGEIVEYYLYYHVLGCMRCRASLALVEHPVPGDPRRAGCQPQPQALAA